MSREWTQQEREKAFESRLARMKRVKNAPTTLTQHIGEEAALLAECELNEALKLLRYIIDVREIKCRHLHPAPDEICAKCRVDAFIERNRTK